MSIKSVCIRNISLRPTGFTPSLRRGHFWSIFHWVISICFLIKGFARFLCFFCGYYALYNRANLFQTLTDPSERFMCNPLKTMQIYWSKALWLFALFLRPFQPSLWDRTEALCELVWTDFRPHCGKTFGPVVGQLLVLIVKFCGIFRYFLIHLHGHFYLKLSIFTRHRFEAYIGIYLRQLFDLGRTFV